MWNGKSLWQVNLLHYFEIWFKQHPRKRQRQGLRGRRPSYHPGHEYIDSIASCESRLNCVTRVKTQFRHASQHTISSCESEGSLKYNASDIPSWSMFSQRPHAEFKIFNTSWRGYVKTERAMCRPKRAVVMKSYLWEPWPWSWPPPSARDARRTSLWPRQNPAGFPVPSSSRTVRWESQCVKIAYVTIMAVTEHSKVPTSRTVRC